MLRHNKYGKKSTFFEIKTLRKKLFEMCQIVKEM
jgi:hypothetical protein